MDTKEVPKIPLDFSKIDKPFGLEQYAFNRIFLGVAHFYTLYFFYLSITQVDFPHVTLLAISLTMGYLGGLGITVGCHRYWSHKTFKATLPLQILLMVMQKVLNHYPIWKWVVDHRIHHKFVDTDADPYNAKRSLWFSHIGWFIFPKHPLHLEKLRTFVMPDLVDDPVVRFDSRWHWILVLIFQHGLPVYFILAVVNLSLNQAIAANFMRFVFAMHFTLCVNSFAHGWGDKPYDKNITSTENSVVAFITIGEGWHNYHHAFPSDYRASEFGFGRSLSTIFIDFFAWLGWAYDLKTVTQDQVIKRLVRTGDGSHPLSGSIEKSD